MGSPNVRGTDVKGHDVYSVHGKNKSYELSLIGRNVKGFLRSKL